MVIVEVIERIIISYDDGEDIIKAYEEAGGGWRKVSNSTTHATFEHRKHAMFSSDNYRKGIMGYECETESKETEKGNKIS
jgi:hypothetical protein